MSIAVNTNLSYFRLRKIIGFLGASIPFIVAAADRSWQPSISDYYYTSGGVLFTGILILTGVFLMSYRGHQRQGEKLTDNIITNLGGFFLVMVAMVPTPYIGECLSGCDVTPICHCDSGWGSVHFGSAVAFFACMGYLSIFRFTRGSENSSRDKILRNRIYRICGYGMLLTLILTGGLYFTIPDKLFFNFIYVMEAIMLVFFGFSWWVKGKGLVLMGLQQDDEE